MILSSVAAKSAALGQESNMNLRTASISFCIRVLAMIIMAGLAVGLLRQGGLWEIPLGAIIAILAALQLLSVVMMIYLDCVGLALVSRHYRRRH